MKGVQCILAIYNIDLYWKSDLSFQFRTLQRTYKIAELEKNQMTGNTVKQIAMKVRSFNQTAIMYR